MVKCKICNKLFKNNMGLSKHIRNSHLINFPNYYVKYYLNDKWPKCSYCKTKNAQFKCCSNFKENNIDNIFKKYCNDKKCISKHNKHNKNISGNGLNSKSSRISMTKNILICNLCGEKFLDFNNKSGALTKHLFNIHNISIKDYNKYFKKIDNNVLPTLKCPLCKWETIDINNRSGMFTTHITKYHKTTIEEFINKFGRIDSIKLALSSQMKKIKTYNSLSSSKDNYINCPICGKKLKRLTNSHAATHSKSIEQIKNEYNITDILSRKSKEKQSIAYWNNTKLPVFVSNAENEVAEFIENLDINIRRNVRNVIINNELDIYIPDKKIAIEYNGLYWHSSEYKNKNYHKNKLELCEKNNIKLIQIFEDEWLNKKDIVKNRLKNILDVNDGIKIYARNCEIKCISSKTSNEFMNKFHLQGKSNTNINFGAFYNNELVSVMTFTLRRNRKFIYNSSNDGEYELLRFATNFKYRCIGIGSKLYKTFIRLYSPVSIISYADRRYTNCFNNIYDKIGMSLISKGNPGYFYINKCNRTPIREHRYKYAKYKLVKKGYDKNKTESQIMKDNNFTTIYDAGQLKFIQSF